MELNEIIPKGGPQRAYCSKCKGSVDLVFQRFANEVSGIAIDIDGMPTLRCEVCNHSALPDRSAAAIVRAHDTALKNGQSAFTATRRKLTERFGFTTVPFDYDPDDYYYYPGLQRPFDIGFLTPVFFNRRVLIKYDASPDYAVRFASPTYGDIVADGFLIPFGINRHGALIMWLGDIAKLPISEQYYLRSENRPSDHTIGSEFYDGQIECIFTRPSLEKKLFAARSTFHEACFKRFGIKLAHLEEEVLEIASTLVRPILDSERDRRFIADTLNKIHLESLDNKALGTLVTSLSLTSKGSGSLKRLQAILESIDAGNTINKLLSPFYTLYDLRVACLHLGSTDSTKTMLDSVTDRLGLPRSADLLSIYDSITDQLTRSYLTLTELVTGEES